MIQVILGDKGSGKTKRLIDLTNDALKSEHGNIIFIDDDKRYMYDLRHEIRFVDASESDIHNADRFYGMLAGMLSVNFDITLVFVDAFMKLVRVPAEQTETFFARLDAISQAHHVSFILSASVDDAVAPEFMKQFFMD